MSRSNEYADRFGRLYARIPKAVFAAVAFSYTSSGGDDMSHGTQRFIEEWRILYDNGIVKQKPPKEVRRAAVRAIPSFVIYDPAQVKTLGDVRYVLQHEVDLFEEGQDGALSAAEVKKVRQVLKELTDER